jgi:hypothetical protein
MTNSTVAVSAEGLLVTPRDVPALAGTLDSLLIGRVLEKDSVKRVHPELRK